VGAQLIMAVVMVSLHRRVFNPSVHPLDLTIGPWMVWICQAVLDPICVADHVEAHRPGIDSVPVARLLGELDAIVRENGVDLLGHGFEHVLQDLPDCLSISHFNELGDGERGCPIYADEEVELAFSGLQLGNVDVEEPIRVALELLPFGLMAFELRQPRDAMSVQTPMERCLDLHRFRSGQVLMLGGPLFEGHG
jgi:hypothetical protein